MKPNESTSPFDPADDRVLKTIRSQNRWLRALTALTVIFWLLAVLGGVGVLVFYTVFYAPKEKQIIRDYETYGHLQDRPQRTTPDQESNHPAMAPERALAIHFTMNYVVTKALLVIAVAIIILSCGTLSTLLLIVLNRRVTLRQINYSLAQISQQLKTLQQGGRG